MKHEHLANHILEWTIKWRVAGDGNGGGHGGLTLNSMMGLVHGRYSVGQVLGTLVEMNAAETIKPYICAIVHTPIWYDKGCTYRYPAWEFGYHDDTRYTDFMRVVRLAKKLYDEHGPTGIGRGGRPSEAEFKRVLKCLEITEKMVKEVNDANNKDKGCCYCDLTTQRWGVRADSVPFGDFQSQLLSAKPKQK